MWKDYVNKYSISDDGQIRNNNTGRVLKLRPSHNGYLRTNISIDGKIKTVFIHRLVAELFIPNPNQLSEVNHIDGNKQNNHKENLEWVTSRQNMIHAKEHNLLNFSRSKKVAQYTLDGIYIQTFNSLHDAARFLGNDKYNSGISNCISGRRKSYKGYLWKLI